MTSGDIRVYVAGPYTKGDPVVNVAAAIDAGDKLATLGFKPFIPHLSMFWHYRRQHDYGFWLEQDSAWLKCCHLLLRLPGESSGADKEVALAQELGIPVCYDIQEVVAYANRTNWFQCATPWAEKVSTNAPVR